MRQTRSSTVRLVLFASIAILCLSGPGLSSPAAGPGLPGAASAASTSRSTTGGVAGQAAGGDGLEAFFATGPVFQDRNDDGFVDFVDAAIVTAGAPGADEVAAAADVAARLGFETMGLNLPLPAEPGVAAASILVGAGGVERAGLSVADAGLGGLADDEGVVTLLQADGGTRVVVAGGGAPGTRAAANVFGGRLPRVWDPSGTSLQEVVDEVTSFLVDRQAPADAVRVAAVRVRQGGDALESLDLVVELAAAAAADAARQALESVVQERSGLAAGDEAPLSYEGARMLRVTLRSGGSEAATVEIPRVEPEPRAGPVSGRPGSGAKGDLDLSNLYTPAGLLGDSDGNQIADRVDALLSPSGTGTAATVDLAARLGLESAGITLPAARPADEVDEPAGQPTLVLIGTDHPLVRQLVDDGVVEAPPLAPGEGLVQAVPEAFGDKTALIVAGGDEAGLERALRQVAERLPHVWDRGKDRTTLDDVELDAWKFFAGRSPAGQAAIALYKLDRIGEQVGGSLASARVLVSIEKPAPGLQDLVRRRAAAALGVAAADVDVVIDDRDVQNAATIFEEEFDVPSEVDAFWSAFETEVLPSLDDGEPVTMEVRLSEPPEVRQRLADEARSRLVEAGADAEGTEVTVLSAYKQGFSWLTEVVQPQLAGRAIGDIVIEFAESVPPTEWPQQGMFTPVRWLKEIFPVDEVFARDLDVELDQVRFEMVDPDTTPIYRVVATAPDGSTIVEDTFDPRYVLRPYYDRFDDYEQVRVTTGWIRAESGGETLVDQRIVTDSEAFWDHWQAETLPAVYDHVMALADKNPRAGDAPFFGELTVDLELSEPDYRLGIDNEIISPLDSMHEEVYFPTLLFFRMLGRMTTGQELDHIGRVIPIMRPKSDGAAGRAQITFTGFATSRPAVVVDYVRDDGSEGSERLDVPKVEMDRPTALAARVRAGSDGIERLDLRIRVNEEEDRRQELLYSHDAEEIDGEYISAAQATATLAHLGELRDAGMYADALSYHDLGEIRVAAGWTWGVDRDAQLVAALPANGTPSPWPDITDLIPAGYEYDGEELVQWETPIPPPEAFEILARMHVAFPEATAYKVGESYLGKELWAMDLMPPVETTHWSQMKATTNKPTVIYSARQHANEVSSTSHVLKLAEMTLTDDRFRQMLQDVNVVIHPITNADGAQLAYDLYEITPDFILHAGYLGSLGVDATTGADEDLPIYPESKVRPNLWATWLPDIFLNPHGYPSHEVVQLFSEYAGLVRRGRVTERNWSYNKGWFIPGFGYLDDPEYPRHKDAAFEIRDRIVENITSAPEVHAMNQRNYDRYRRYGVQFDNQALKMQMVGDVLIYMPLEGARAGGRGFDPAVTIWEGGTEAPDETAYGEWMEIVATAGLQWDIAILEYLAEGDHRVNREGSSFFDGVRLSLDRPRPPEPPEEEGEGGSGGS